MSAGLSSHAMAVLPENLSGLLSRIQTTALIGSILAVIIASVVLSTLRQYYRLRHIKGPASAGFSRWWLLSHVTGGRMHLDLYDVCHRYGMSCLQQHFFQGQSR